MADEETIPVEPLESGDPSRVGPYRLLGRLGQGGMGSVYLARGADDRPIAVKTLLGRFANDAEFRHRFRREVDRARQVPPFCTAEVFDADPDHDPPYLVVEYVEGPSLTEAVRTRGPFTPANLHGLAIGVAAALTAIHSAGVIHRDLKPSNVMLALGGPKVIDFGIAREIDSSTVLSSSKPGQLIGTVPYMAPERLDSSGAPLTPAVDVFAWGALIAYAGTGRNPFATDSLPATVARILTRPPNLDGLDASLRPLVEQSLAKNPADRPTAHQLLQRLLGRPSDDERELGTTVEETIKNLYTVRDVPDATHTDTPTATTTAVVATVADDDSGGGRPGGTGIRRRPRPVAVVVAAAAAVAVAALALILLPNWGGTPGGSSATPGRTLAASGPFQIALGDLLTKDRPAAGAGNIESPGAQDVYEFTAEKGQKIFLDARESAPNLNWILYDPEESIVFGGTGMNNEFSQMPEDQGPHTLAFDGTYQLVVYGKADAVGTYRAKLWSVPSQETVTLRLGEQISDGQPAAGAGNIETPGAQDVYEFTAEKGQKIFLDARESAPNLNWILYDPEESIVFGGTGMNNEFSQMPEDQGPHTLAFDGTYQLVVYGKADAVGTYRVKVEAR
ncbi:serine/threonine protein kinase [Streptosporangium sp. DT93]|uniref:serine/threonine protein kinase n=1 Tax=Streptosporangium sp. DT93 TaxID=3393428 RepID=UPI003CECB1B5